MVLIMNMLNETRTDFIGNMLNIGDTICIVEIPIVNRHKLLKGVIIGFTKCGVKVEVYTHDHKSDYGVNSKSMQVVTRLPEQCVLLST